MSRVGMVVGAIAGIVAGGLAIGVAELVSGLVGRRAFPVDAVGSAAIDVAPGPVKQFAISTFGAHDKTVLLGGILVVLAVIAALLGVVATRRVGHALVGLGCVVAVGVAAALTRPGATAVDALPTLVGGAVAASTLSWLVHTAGRRPHVDAATGGMLRAPRVAADGEPGTVSSSPSAASGATAVSRARTAGREGGGVTVRRVAAAGPGRPRPSRRQLLASSGAAVVLAAATGAAGRELATRRSVTRARELLRFPAPARPAPPLPPGSDLHIPGLSPFLTPNARFYRVDTAIILPEVAPQTWRLRVHGMVQRELDIDFAALLRRPLIEDYITLTCVSNPVGGPYVGNAKWLGASLASLIREARPRAGADQLLCTSIDGFTSGTPLAVVLDGRDALLAVAMNGTALPVAHGFPVRMVVPGLYGYVSATKWVTDIEVTTFAAHRAYWVQRGWAQQAPIKTESRIDVPTDGVTLAAGRTPVAGVAWAQHKGIAAVQVRVDHGDWHEAQLAAVPDIDTWRQWVWYWDATPGGHLIEARATDATGYTQTAVVTPTVPNGATGYPSITVTVR